MGRDPIKNQTPDLFSTGRLDGSPPNNPPEALPRQPSRRTALPKDLPRAIRYLEDQELDWLLRAAIHEVERRGWPMPMAEASPTNTPAVSSEPIPKQTKSPGRPTRQRQVGVAAAALTKGQVRAAFKAGVTPARIARQFGISQSNVRKALATDQPKR
jgi:DNA-binding CsgD family transcriptional regulator